MKKKRTSTSGLFNRRVLLAFALCSVGVFLAISSFTGMGWDSVGRPDGSDSQEGRGDTDRLERYMPIPGGDADDLNRLEIDWNNRLTYRSEEHTSELQSPCNIVCRFLLETNTASALRGFSTRAVPIPGQALCFSRAA